ncbi:MAG: hydantoinase/oxoprolinase family protein [Armatimonadetes bacterium]|nr:hydantoinase/oxoprolinase family protein [Armatimonadota bacterium]
MAIYLGIDTGGTYTDAVLYDDRAGVLASAKALTTKHDLSLGIREAVDAVLPDPHPTIHLVSLSTTLATNAIVEGHGSPICLLLLGYPQDVLDQDGLRQALGANPVAFITGGHTVTGEEQAPLDREAVRRAIAAHAGGVSAFAVSGYFAVLNPTHELAARALIREATHLPVTCGHELTSNLHAPRRALTTALNARLIPLLQQLILAVRGMLEEKAIRAPLMVVKGDGSLVAADFALERPVETILSGPAASVVGARHLSGEENVFVVDMGGTTTDIALLRDGRPMLNLEGASVGGWRTMVEAVAVHTFGLGGDSEVRLDERLGPVLGPRRVVPLSLLACQHPGVAAALELQLARAEPEAHDGRFVLRQRPRDGARSAFSGAEESVWEALAGGPVAMEDLLAGAPIPLFRRLAIDDLVGRGLVVVSGFTPTDAAHVLGLQRHWSGPAARLGATLCARQAMEYSWGQGLSAESLCEAVVDRMTVQAGGSLVTTALAEADGVALDGHGPLRRLFVDRALSADGKDGALMDVALTLRRPLVAVGAPVATFYPVVAERLRTGLCIPRHAEIANALGAVVGGIAQHARALIKPGSTGYRVHLPTGVENYGDREKAVEAAIRHVRALAEAHARRAGATDVQVHIERKDHIGHGRGEDVYLDTEVLATALGRPRVET